MILNCSKFSALATLATLSSKVASSNKINKSRHKLSWDCSPWMWLLLPCGCGYCLCSFNLNLVSVRWCFKWCLLRVVTRHKLHVMDFQLRVDCVCLVVFVVVVLVAQPSPPQMHPVFSIAASNSGVHLQLFPDASCKLRGSILSCVSLAFANGIAIFAALAAWATIC